MNIKVNRMKTLKISLLIALGFFWGNSEAQQVLSGSGATFQNQLCMVSFTVGETIVGNLSGSNCRVSQGFQQSLINPVGVLENSTKTIITISPNPTRNILYINGLKPNQDVEIAIVNIHGNIELMASYCKEHFLDVTSLSKGFYIVQIKSGETRIIEKLIIE